MAASPRLRRVGSGRPPSACQEAVDTASGDLLRRSPVPADVRQREHTA